MLGERVSALFVLLLGVPGLALAILGGLIVVLARSDTDDPGPRRMLRAGITMLGAAAVVVFMDLIFLPQPG